MSHGHKFKQNLSYLVWTVSGVKVTNDCPKGVTVFRSKTEDEHLWTFAGDKISKEYKVGVDSRLSGNRDCGSNTPIGVYNPRNPQHLEHLVEHVASATRLLAQQRA